MNLLNEAREISIRLAEIRIDLMAFFNANPFTHDTVAGLALRINRGEEEIRLSLRKLEDSGLLRRSGEGETAVYRLSRPYAPEGGEGYAG